jgi:hypothetical protein
MGTPAGGGAAALAAATAEVGWAESPAVAAALAASLRHGPGGKALHDAAAGLGLPAGPASHRR